MIRISGRVGAVALIISASLLSACGGGGGGSATGNPLPVASPTSNPPVGQAVTLGSSPTTVILPAVSGYTAQVAMPAGSGSGTVAVSTQSTSGVTLQDRGAMVANSPLLYIAVTATTNLTLNGIPGVTLTVPSGVSGTVYVAGLTNGAWTTVAGPGTISNGSVTFPAQAGTITLQAGQTVYFAIYQGSPIASPTPLPSPTSSTTPATTPSASPSPTPTTKATPTPAPTIPPVTPAPSPTATPTSTPAPTVNILSISPSTSAANPATISRTSATTFTIHTDVATRPGVIYGYSGGNCANITYQLGQNSTSSTINVQGSSTASANCTETIQYPMYSSNNATATIYITVP